MEIPQCFLGILWPIILKTNLQEEFSEVLNPFRILGQAREQCSTAAKLLDSRDKLLRKHKIPTPDMTPSAADNIGDEQPATAEPQGNECLWSGGDGLNGAGVFAGFEGPFQDSEPNIDFDAQAWNSLLSGFSSTFA